MTYKIDGDLARKGMEEVLKIAVNRFESAFEGDRNLDLQTIVNDYFKASEIARDVGVNTLLYDDILLSKTKELKQRYGVEIK
ncbi:hypothetical protein HYT25_04585 [Candidatus Pacearchaeota archaeon]|nr:hypothetical protein [Candidatus Pacearchaeota archaeon]